MANAASILDSRWLDCQIHIEGSNRILFLFFVLFEFIGVRQTHCDSVWVLQSVRGFSALAAAAPTVERQSISHLLTDYYEKAELTLFVILSIAWERTQAILGRFFDSRLGCNLRHWRCTVLSESLGLNGICLSHTKQSVKIRFSQCGLQSELIRWSYLLHCRQIWLCLRWNSSFRSQAFTHVTFPSRSIRMSQFSWQSRVKTHW